MDAFYTDSLALRRPVESYPLSEDAYLDGLDDRAQELFGHLELYEPSMLFELQLALQAIDNLDEARKNRIRKRIVQYHRGRIGKLFEDALSEARGRNPDLALSYDEELQKAAADAGDDDVDVDVHNHIRAIYSMIMDNPANKYPI